MAGNGLVGDRRRRQLEAVEEKSRERIDGIVALIMGLERAFDAVPRIKAITC